MEFVIRFVILATLLLIPAYGNDDEVIRYMELLENMELLEDENYQEIVDSDVDIEEEDE